MIMQKFLNKREHLMLYLAIGVMAFAAVFNLLLYPLLQRNDTLNREINLARSKLKNYARLLSQKDYIMHRYNTFAPQLKLPQDNESGIVSSLSEIENLAKASRVHIIDIRPQSQKGGSALYIDVRAEANLESFLRFIYEIENSLSVLKIKKFQLNSRSGSTALEGIFIISQFSAAD